MTSCDPTCGPTRPTSSPTSSRTVGRPRSGCGILLAATLGANYGIYGPAFEHMEREPREQGSEEYRDSEKYQRRFRKAAATGMRELIARVNQIRREHPALQHDRTLRFHPMDNDQLIAYSKTLPDGTRPGRRHREPRSGASSVRLGRPAHAGARDGLGCTLHRSRPARRRVLRVDRGTQLRGAAPRASAGPRVRDRARPGGAAP